MKKVCILFLSLFLLAGAGGTARAAGADIVVLMDASGTILPWFDQINGRILTDITKKFVRTGDTFHLISFNSRSNLEIVQPVLGEADVSRIVSRFMLLYPIGQNSDFLSGLQYTWQYVNTLDQLKQKIVIVISDGIFNPPSSSQFAAYTNAQVTSELESYAKKIRSAGWSVYYIKLPFPENASITALDGSTVSVPAASTALGNTRTDNAAGGQNAADGKAQDGDNHEAPAKATEYVDVSGSFTEAVGIGTTSLPEGDIPLDFIDSVFDLPEVTFPSSLGKTGRTFILPLGIRNKGNKDLHLELTGVTVGAAEVLQKHAFVSLGKNDKGTLKAEIKLPDSIANGDQSLRFSLQFAGNARVHPQEGTVTMFVTGFSPLIAFRQGGSVAFAILLIALAAAFVLTLIILVIRHTAAPAHKALRSVQTEEDASSIGIRERDQEKKPAASNTFGPGLSVTESAERSGKKSLDDYAAAASADSKKAMATDAYRTTADKKIASEMAASAWSGSEILKREKADKNIAFARETDKKIAYDAPQSIDLNHEVNDFAAIQEQQKRDRYNTLTESARKPIHHSHIPAGADPDTAVPVLERRSLMFELQVRYQTRMIGKRNVHVMKAGSKLSLGGGNSAFLVFLVKFPHRIADVRFDGKQCSLAILKPEYFPYESENIVENCVGREFVIVSDRDYEVCFTLKEYEDPVVKLNRLLTSIRF